MPQEVMTLSVDTGSVLINVDDKGEVIGQFRFNPSDLDILRRYESVVDAMNAIVIPEDAGADDMLRVSDEIKKQFDFLLNYNVSDGIFAKCNPFSMTAGGDFYFESVLDGIAGLIEKVTNQRIEKKRKKIEKATAKYHK